VSFDEPAGGYAAARDLRRLESTVSSNQHELEESVSSVRRDVEMLEGTTQGLLGDVEKLQQDVEESVDELTTTTARQATMIGRLVRQLAWLEQHVTLTTGRPATLDDVTASMKRTATAARTYEVMVSQLLTDAQVAQHQREIAAWEKWESTKNRLDTELIAATQSALRGVNAVPTDGGPVGVAKVESLAKEQKDHAQHKAWLKPQASRARRALADHNALLEQFGSTLTTGKAARSKLAAEVRSRIEAMLAEPDELPPLWFSIALGQRPPADRRTKWLEAAEAVVLYRVMYDVNHQVDALGPDTVTDAVQNKLRANAARLLVQFARG
jgi:hypothetical protein